MKGTRTASGRILAIFLSSALFMQVPPTACRAEDDPAPSAAQTMGEPRIASLHVPDLIALPEFREPSTPREAVPAPAGARESGGSNHLHALVHLIGSHLGIVTRPVSAVRKLASVLFYTGQDTLRNILISDSVSGSASPCDAGPGMAAAEWERTLDRITGTGSTTGRIGFLIDGEQFYSRLTTSFLEAEESIHIRIYIYDNDDYALEMADLLRERSQEVDVRILVDGLGTIMANGVHPDSVSTGHHPPASIKGYLTKGSKVRMRCYKNLWLTLDHTKTILVDEKTAFVGGMNIGREYRYHWHDLMMEVHGPVVEDLQGEFNAAWAYAGLLGDLGKALAPGGHSGADDTGEGYPIRILHTRAGNSQIYRAQMAAIRMARDYIFIHTPYFADDAILSELIKARERDVDVRVILPAEGNWKVMDRSNRVVANRMLESGIKVYLYPSMSHVKAAVFDGWVCVGSANIDKASFRTNQEINLATSDPEVAEELLERLFYPDFERSTLMEKPEATSWSDRIYEVVADQM